MEQLQADWSTIERHLQGISGLDAKGLGQLKAYFEEGEAKKGIHFFLIQYAPGEVIMAKGTTSDYAAIHVQGRVRIRDAAPSSRKHGEGCWEKPLARRLEDIVLCQAATWPKDAAPGRGLFGWLAPLYRWFPGIPVRLIEFCDHWISAALASRLRNHVARALRGRMPEVSRLERKLSDPNAAEVADPRRRGVDSGKDGPDSEEPVLTIRSPANDTKPVEDRFLGVAGTLWNQPRSVTLVADNDPDDGDKPCVMLLIKRKALEEIAKKSPRFYEQKMAEFVRSTLPDVLAKNRLFRDRLFAEDVLDWKALLDGLQGKTPGSARVEKLLREIGTALPWLAKASPATLDGPERAQIIERLNQALTDPQLIAPEARLAADGEADEVAGRYAVMNDCEVFRMNRLLLEAAAPGALAQTPKPFPLTRAEFREFTALLVERHSKKFGKTLLPERLENKDKKSAKRGVTVFKQGDPADAIFLILSGMVRVNVDLAGGQSMVNNLEAGAFFGESAVLDDGPDGGLPVRSAAIETLCHTTLLRLDRDVLRSMFADRYQALEERIRRGRKLVSMRDEYMRMGRLLPPHEPPLAIAEKLMMTRNLLLIDMHRCTRCDQCVRGCAEAHDGVPRFHRANPQMRFGKWEAAGACMHCLDAPCQQTCPVGAITWLENHAVQIHRDRCIGCSQCASECPFGVIDMYEPFAPGDAPSSKKGIVANKCDLCLTDEHDPPCVAWCPYDAARRVDPVAFFPELKSWANFTDRQ